tara:strand:- start:31 stop:306 length:276 start_codon:yes stop_codon:yes gene_type:complete
MTQYEDRVEQQRLKIEAEEWAKGVKTLHSHSLNSMWYDNRPQDTEDGKRVIDLCYNDGSIRRTLSDGGVIIMGDQLKGQELIESFVKHQQG